MGISSFKSGFTKITALPTATVTATTGSPTIDTSSRAGKTIYKFTGSGSITIGTAGSCEYLVIGGGNNNGAGGYIYNTSAVLQAGTLTVTVGAGANTYTGNASQIKDIVAYGGGYVGINTSGGQLLTSGGSGGGTYVTGTVNTAILSGAQGNNSGQGFSGGPPGIGGGGGAGGVGGNAASTSVGGNGGAGAANSITGSSVTYSAGAGGYGTSTTGTPYGAGAANTGNGGGGAAGGSGFVVIVIG